MKNSKYLDRVFFSFIWLLTFSTLDAQNTFKVTLDSCYQWAQENYPLSKQYNLLEQTKDLTLENLATKILPRLHLIGQASYQSDVTEIPVMIPGSDITLISKDQYKVYGEITQPLTEFQTIRQEKELAKTNYSIQKRELAISLRQLKERVNSLFFSILLLEAHTEQIRITRADITSGLQHLNTAVKNGTALPSDIHQLKAELLQLDQQIYSLESRRNQLIRALSLLTGQSIEQKSTFRRPIVPTQTPYLQRPELELFNMQQSVIDQQKSLFHQRIKPQLNLFVQSGYGRPALNFLDNDFSAYFIVGIRFQWNMTSYYTRQNKDQLWDVQKRSLDLKTETFRLNTRLRQEQYNEEIQRYQNLLRTDQEIIALRMSIKNSSARQLTQGVITSVDYLVFVHKEEQARQSSVLHEIQLLQAYYNWLYENGN